MAMGPQDRNLAQTRVVERAGADIDEGLRAYMLRVYNYMSAGLAITGVIAYVSAIVPAIQEMLYVTEFGGLQPTILGWIVMFSPLAFVFFLSARISSMSLGAAQTTFWAFAGLMGLSLSYVFLIYTGASIARVFFITAGTFGAMSLYGYTTKKDLTGWGSFLIMGLIGIIIASIVNMFLQSAAMHFAISIIGVLIFVGLTAYDTQKIKESYQVSDSGEIAGKKAIMGALRLYLDFINLFLMLLRLFGNRN